MVNRDGVFLTGGTGFLGRHLLRDLLQSGNRVAVLARDDASTDAEDRVRELIDFASRTLSLNVPQPTVIRGDLREPGLGLTTSDRAWLSRNCRRVIHAAASVSFRADSEGEPRATNLDGTKRLLEVCSDLGICEFHHVSTAFVCGERTDPVLESDLRETNFHNDYERSKYETELLLQERSEIRATVYRPSVIVGDSRTGYTSTYHGFYRFLELVDRLARKEGKPGKRRLPLRVPFTGDELRNLVPVDWVSQAIVRIVARPQFHGQTFHLTTPEPISIRAIKAAADRELGISGIELAGPKPMIAPTELERAFHGGVREYLPYLSGDPTFDCRNTLEAIPDLPAPPIDADMLARLIRFGAADKWGRKRRETPAVGGADCAEYIERYFPEAMTESFLSQIPITATLGFAIRGPGGGRWVCRFGDGRVLGVSRGFKEPAEVTYRMDVRTFTEIVSGRESPQDAFFARRIEIVGSIERGLKLAVLFGRFVRESPYQPQTTEERHAVAG